MILQSLQTEMVAALCSLLHHIVNTLLPSHPSNEGDACCCSRHLFPSLLPSWSLCHPVRTYHRMTVYPAPIFISITYTWEGLQVCPTTMSVGNIDTNFHRE